MLYDLYERCVQAPMATVRFLASVHGHSPRVLREDFCGSAGICRAWVEMIPGGRAVAVDRAAEPLRRVRAVPGITAVRTDVLTAPHKADIIAALNFPLGYWYTREQLVRYLSLSRACLTRGGIFVGDMYGGTSAFTVCTRTAAVAMPDGTPVRYEWEQRRVDILSNRVFNSIHFHIGTGRNTRHIRDAFAYDWRLWSLQELRDACGEAGFRRVEIYDQRSSAMDHLGNVHMRRIESGEDLDGSDWVVNVVGRK